MHFTLWPSLTETSGGHAEITWESFLSFVSSPQVAADKKLLEGWSPAKFMGDRRARAACELVSAIVLDDDASGLTLESVCGVWGGFEGVIHSSFSHTDEAPKWRIVLRCSRDMTPDEHARVWALVSAHACGRGQPVDEATRDPSRLWFVPGHAEGAPFVVSVMAGHVIDVDRALAAQISAPDPPVKLADSVRAPDTRRASMAAALKAAWPPTGRHVAQLALAGALRAEGWPPEDAVDFLAAVAGDRPKRQATVAHTWGLAEGAPMTGWATLRAHVDPVVVDLVRGGLARDAEWTERTNRRLVEVVGAVVVIPEGETIKAGPFIFSVGGFDKDQPPLTYLVESLICRADVAMLVAHGNSLKTWLAFSIALAVATGRPWLGRFAVLRGRVAILDFESGDFEVVRRLKLLGAKDQDADKRLLRCSYSGANLSDPETWIALAGLGLDLLVIDSFNAASPETDENDARAALMLQHAGKFSNATGCTVVVIHHSRKGSGGDRRESVRGSSALFAACDRIFEFYDLEKADGGVILSTMASVKDGAGRTPPNVRVELSDAGLRYVDEPPTEDEKSGEEKNRELVVSILRERSAGVPKADLLNLLKGENKIRRAVLSAMNVAGITVEFTAEKKVFVMLNPHGKA